MMDTKSMMLMGAYGYITLVMGPKYMGDTTTGYLAGAAASYALYQTVGKNL